MLVALVTAIPAALLEAGASLAWKTVLQDGKGSGPGVWGDSAVTCSCGWVRDPSGPVADPPTFPAPAACGGPGPSRLGPGQALPGYRAGEANRSRTATPPHLDLVGPRTCRHRVRARGPRVPCLPFPPNPRVLGAPPERGGRGGGGEGEG